MTGQEARLRFTLSIVIYGTIGLLVHYINASAEFIVLCRGVIGTLSILLLLRLKRQRLDWAALRRNLLPLLLSGMALGLNWVTLFSAYAYTTVAIATLCNYMAPIYLILLAPLLLHEPLVRRKLVCFATAFCGIVLVTGVLESRVEVIDLRGVALGLVGSVCFAVVVLCNKKIDGVAPLERTAVQLCVSALTVLPYVLLRLDYAFPAPNLRAVLLILILGVIHTGLAYILYFSAMRYLSMQSIAIIGYLEPVEAVLVSVLLLHEPISPIGLAGAGLIVGSALVSEFLREKPRSV